MYTAEQPGCQMLCCSFLALIAHLITLSTNLTGVMVPLFLNQSFSASQKLFKTFQGEKEDRRETTGSSDVDIHTIPDNLKEM